MRNPFPTSVRTFCVSSLIRKIGAASLASAVLINGGCVGTSPRQWVTNGFKVGPNYSAPAGHVALAWIGADDPRVESVRASDNWWEVFHDPILDSLAEQAYRQNPSLQAVGTRVTQARAQQAIATGNLFPQTQQVLGFFPQGGIGGNSSHLDLTAFNLSWEMDFWGKYRRQIESANAQLQASDENYNAALVTLLGDVATNYVQYRVAQQRIRIFRDNLDRQERLLALAEEQFKVGTGNELDVEQLRTLVEQTRATVPALQIGQGQANDTLCILLGEPPRDLESELGPGPELGRLPTPVVPASVSVGIPADLLLRRPDVRSAERQLAAQAEQIGVAEADLYPSLSVGTALGYTDVNLASKIATSGGLALVIPQFSWKILNYGRLVNNINLQDARTQELLATFENKVLTAAQEVQTALRAFLRSQTQTDALSRSVNAAVAATKTEEQLFTKVKADVNRLFTLENARLQAQDQLAVAQGNIALNLITVYRALGGGWEIRCPKGVGPAAHPDGESSQVPPATDRD